MLEILRDENKNIKAVCEWWLVNQDGSFNPNGEFVWISELELSPEYRGNGCLKCFIKEIILKVPKAKFGYFWRQYKYEGRPPRIYAKRQWLNRIK